MWRQTLYLKIDALWARAADIACIADLKLKGASVPWTGNIEGRVRIRGAAKLTVANQFEFLRNVTFNIDRGCITLDEHVSLGQNVRLDAVSGEIHIGSNVLINSNSIVTAWSGVTIGENTQIAPFCHLTDRNHGIAKCDLIRKQAGPTAPIVVGSDVWIGSSCIVLQGVTIGDGAVIGANSLVNKSIPPYTIAGGSPARVLKDRK